MMKIKFRGVFLGAMLLLNACKPSPEQQAKIAEEKRKQCLDRICAGDVEPKVDKQNFSLFKRNGHWFAIPVEYCTGTSAFAFYWPSKTPACTRKQDFPEKKMVTSGNTSTDIEFFIESKSHQAEMYELISNGYREGKILKQEEIRPELELIQIKGDPGIEPVETYYVAKHLKTPAGIAPTVHCRTRLETNRCTSGFAWKPGYRIYVRFNQKHGKDWPEIYSEIIRVLEQVKEL